MAKFEIKVETCDLENSGSIAIKAGDKVHIERNDDDSCSIIKDDGIRIGSIPTAELERFQSGASFSGEVRTIRREPGTETIAAVTIRFQPSASILPGARHVHIEEDTLDDEEGILRLSREQCDNLAYDDKTRWYLRDERLQQVVQAIDAAPNREQALVQALEAPNFKEFADHVLQTMAPNPPEAGE